jgi:uncharacterized DUF497 family protein
MNVEYDEEKRAETLHVRGLDMARVSEVFGGARLTRPDNRRDYGEERFITVGLLDCRLVVVAWTQRADSIRVISMRKANGREQRLYAPVLGR